MSHFMKQGKFMICMSLFEQLPSDSILRALRQTSLAGSKKTV